MLEKYIVNFSEKVWMTNKIKQIIVQSKLSKSNVKIDKKNFRSVHSANSRRECLFLICFFFFSWKPDGAGEIFLIRGEGDRTCFAQAVGTPRKDSTGSTEGSWFFPRRLWWLTFSSQSLSAGCWYNSEPPTVSCIHWQKWGSYLWEN